MTLTQIETIQQGIIEHFSANGAGYCEVPSASDANTKYRVYFNDQLYSTSCDCRGGHFDCGHKVATDRHFDTRREDQRKAAKVAKIEENGLDSCDTCGRPIKKGTIVCAKCLGC